MFRKHNLWFLTVTSCLMLMSVGAFADPTPPAGNYNIIGTENYAEGRPIVASKAYVDNRTDLAYHTLDVAKQDNIAAKSGTAKILIQPDTAGGQPGTTTIATSIVTTGANANADDNYIPTVGAVEGLINTATTDSHTHANGTHTEVTTNGAGAKVIDVKAYGDNGEDFTNDTDIIQGNMASWHVANDNKIPTVRAVKAALDAQTSAAVNAYQPKSTGTTNQVGNAGSWKTLTDGTYVTQTTNGNNVTFDIPAAQRTSATSDVVTNGTKLVTSGVLADYHDASKQDKLPYNATAKVIIAPTTDGGAATVRDITNLGTEVNSTDDGLTTGKAVYEYVTNYHDSSKVDVAQGTGYKVLTTGTNGNVTTEYLKVPVTASGEPSASNAPTTVASMWLE